MDISVLSSELSADRLTISLRNSPPQPLEACADSENETRQQLRQLVTLKASHSHVLFKTPNVSLMSAITERAGEHKHTDLFYNIQTKINQPNVLKLQPNFK